jgi:hypothetical protein
MYACTPEPAADFPRSCACSARGQPISATRPYRFANRVPPAPVVAKANGADDMLSAPFVRSGIDEALGHKLVDVVVVAVLDAGADASGPRGPQAVADPALAEGCNARG